MDFLLVGLFFSRAPATSAVSTVGSLRLSVLDPPCILFNQLDVPTVCVSLHARANCLSSDRLLTELLPSLVIVFRAARGLT